VVTAVRQLVVVGEKRLLVLVVRSVFFSSFTMPVDDLVGVVKEEDGAVALVTFAFATAAARAARGTASAVSCRIQTESKQCTLIQSSTDPALAAEQMGTPQ
jgi:hypothetical protein